MNEQKDRKIIRDDRSYRIYKLSEEGSHSYLGQPLIKVIVKIKGMPESRQNIMRDPQRQSSLAEAVEEDIQFYLTRGWREG